jgi:hypothetical protein
MGELHGLCFNVYPLQALGLRLWENILLFK